MSAAVNYSQRCAMQRGFLVGAPSKLDANGRTPKKSGDTLGPAHTRAKNPPHSNTATGNP